MEANTLPSVSALQSLESVSKAQGTWASAIAAEVPIEGKSVQQQTLLAVLEEVVGEELKSSLGRAPEDRGLMTALTS